MKIFNKNIKLYEFPISNIPKIKKAITEEDLEEGEMICSKCKGVGFLNKIKSENTSMYKDICPKCQGSGKLDWIENVMGKKPVCRGTSTSGPSMSSGSFSVNWKDVNSGFHGTSCLGLRDVIIKQAAEHIAKKIDDEILEMIKKGG